MYLFLHYKGNTCVLKNRGNKEKQKENIYHTTSKMQLLRFGETYNFQLKNII